MQTTQAMSLTPNLRATVAIELIGDLDAVLGSNFADTLALLIAGGTTDVLVTTKHVVLSSAEGLREIDVAMTGAREHGCSVSVEPGSRRMKAAFAAASVRFERTLTEGQPCARHLMLARHAERPQLRRSA